MKTYMRLFFVALVWLVFMAAIGIFLLAISTLAEASVHTSQEIVEAHNSYPTCQTVVITGGYDGVPPCQDVRTALGDVELADEGGNPPTPVEQVAAILAHPATPAGGFLILLLVILL